MGFAPAYVAAALIGSVVYYLILKKKIFDKHVHSETLIKAMAINMAINLLAVAAMAFVVFATEKTSFIFKKILVTGQPNNIANLLLLIAAYVVVICTTVTGARISLKRKGHKNLKLEKILTSDFAVTGACTAIATLGFIASFIVR